MTEIKQTSITKDASNKKLVVTREFDAPVDQVWKAWTDSELLDQWWAPKPWKAETKNMDFREGGSWLYAMVGPDGAKEWCKADYYKISAPKRFTCADYFCDENGNKKTDFPTMEWENTFSASGSGTLVRIELTFETE